MNNNINSYTVIIFLFGNLLFNSFICVRYPSTSSSLLFSNFSYFKCNFSNSDFNFPFSYYENTI